MTPCTSRPTRYYTAPLDHCSSPPRIQSTSATPANTPRLPAHKKHLPPLRSPASPRSTPHRLPTPPFHPTHAAHQVSRSRQSLSALASPTLSSPHSETHPRIVSLLRTRMSFRMRRRQRRACECRK